MGVRKYPAEFPIEVKAFGRMQTRVASGYSTTIWPRTTEGFLAFLETVGKVPKEMKQPSIGRKDHTKGYEPGNCGWQEHYDNIMDGCLRMGAAHKGEKYSKKHRKNLSLSHQGPKPWLKGRKLSKERCLQISLAKKNKKWSKSKRLDSARAKVSATHKGAKRSVETKKKQSEARSLWWKNRKDKKSSLKTKRKISKGLKLHNQHKRDGNKNRIKIITLLLNKINLENQT